MNKLCCITPTGDRPEAFRLCAKYMERQTLRPWCWIIIDDGRSDIVMRVTEKLSIPHEVLRLPPMPGHSLVRNLRAAFKWIPDDAALCMIEDDDYYPEQYLETMNELLRKNESVGARTHLYYNVRARRFRLFHNSTTMALHSLGFAGSAIPFFRSLLDSATHYDVDKVFGEKWRKKRAYNDTVPPVHIVGFGSGRPGTTPAHRVTAETDTLRWKPDPRGEKLREWIGEDSKAYLEI